jgi:hypothetical protein
MNRTKGRADRNSPRVAGQGAREKANELAAKSPIKTLLSKMTFDVFATEEKAWRIGAEHEEDVGRRLGQLSSSIGTSGTT